MSCIMDRKLRLARTGIYILLWIILTFFLLFLYYDYSAPFYRQLISTFVITGLSAFPAYFGAKVLVPRYLYQKKFGTFISAMALMAIISSLLTFVIGGGLYSLLSEKPLILNTRFIIIIAPLIFIINSVVIITSSAIKIITDKFGIEQELHKAESEKISNELSFLRAQINPHFLFNVLNTIYFQIQKENSGARSSVEKFSEMLRYQLYDCNTDMIDIAKELLYIRNYVAIQQLRMEEGTDLQIDIREDISSFKIAPLLILPLIENAFKFISNHKDPSQNMLHISISMSPEKELVVSVMNTFNKADRDMRSSDSNGVGLKNMQRRLLLLYPETHSLLVAENGIIYETTLRLQCHD